MARPHSVLHLIGLNSAAVMLIIAAVCNPATAATSQAADKLVNGGSADVGKENADIGQANPNIESPDTYWTADRLKSAKPLELPRAPGTPGNKLVVTPPEAKPEIIQPSNPGGSHAEHDSTDLRSAE